MTQFTKTSSLLILSTFVSISFADLLTVMDIQASQGNRDEVHETKGLVYGAKPCGGPGQLLHVHYEACTTTNSICQVPANQSFPGFVEFIPSVDITQLGLRSFMSENGYNLTIVADVNITSAPLVAGVETRVSGSFGFDEQLKGKLLTFQDILYNVENGVIELCIESQYEVV